MQRLGLTLAITQLALYLALILLGWHELELSRKWAGYIDAPYSSPFAWAMGINLPAVLLWIPLELGALAFSRLFGVSSDIPSAVAFGLAVFGFWLWVGVRLERASILQRNRGTSKATGRIVVLILCSLLLVTSVAVFLLFRDAYLIEMKLPMVDWLIVGVWVALRRLLRSAPRSSTSDQVGGDRQM